MIAYAYGLTSLWFPYGLAEQAKRHAERAQQREGMEMQHGMAGSWREKLVSRRGWEQIAHTFFMEWKMVWKEILLGFTVAGFIAVFVPQSFWNSLFLIEEGRSASPSFLIVLENALVAPVVAFFTFIGSMGNVRLAAMLWSREASFGGVMAFLGADLVAATVIWVHAKYYGWRYAFYLSAVLYVCMVAAGVSVHYLFALLGAVPTERIPLQEMVRFQIDHTFYLNIAFSLVAGILVWLHISSRGGGDRQQARAGKQATTGVA
jgi:uncharacterized membrane protein YraQ (UPF0718 family)